jgi:hypothetical protein
VAVLLLVYTTVYTGAWQPYLLLLDTRKIFEKSYFGASASKRALGLATLAPHLLPF